jgi:hypothetical protein
MPLLVKPRRSARKPTTDVPTLGKIEIRGPTRPNFNACTSRGISNSQLVVR